MNKSRKTVRGFNQQQTKIKNDTLQSGLAPPPPFLHVRAVDVRVVDVVEDDDDETDQTVIYSLILRLKLHAYTNA